MGEAAREQMEGQRASKARLPATSGSRAAPRPPAQPGSEPAGPATARGRHAWPPGWRAPPGAARRPARGVPGGRGAPASPPAPRADPGPPPASARGDGLARPERAGRRAGGPETEQKRLC